MKPSRNLWPLGIITAFGVLILGIATIIFIAATHRDTLVNPNYYENELKFQTQIDSAARAQNSGAKLIYDSKAGRITVAIPGGQMTQQFSGSIELYRPSSSALDHQVLLTPNADGRQTLDVSQLAAGPWSVRVNWKSGGQDYFRELKFVVPK